MTQFDVSVDFHIFYVFNLLLHLCNRVQVNRSESLCAFY